MAKEKNGFIDFLKDIPDHRIERRKLYPVEEILLVAFCGTIAGCNGWDAMELFGKTQIKSLRRYSAFKNGIPSDDTLRRFFRALDPEVFELAFIRWVETFRIDLAQKVIAVDGKTSRRSHDGKHKALHLVSAFASELGVTLGQVKTDEKSNEITAIPELLEMLDIKGSIITIDAAGCQKDIVNMIVEKGADYLIGLKGNQGTIHRDVKLYFDQIPDVTRIKTAVTRDKGHGRIETRRCSVTDDVAWLKEHRPEWGSIMSIVQIESTRVINKETKTHKRYYLSSLPSDPEKILTTTRQHWGIENQLHWVLDVTFGDDESRIRKGNAPRNMVLIKKAVLNTLKAAKLKNPRLSYKMMRRLAGWDHQFLDSVVKGKF